MNNPQTIPNPAEADQARPAVKAADVDGGASSLRPFTWAEHDAIKAQACRLFAESARLYARAEALDAEIERRHPTDRNQQEADAAMRRSVLYDQTAREYEKTAQILEAGR